MILLQIFDKTHFNKVDTSEDLSSKMRFFFFVFFMIKNILNEFNNVQKMMFQ